MLKNRGENRIGKENQAQSRRRRHHQHPAQPPIQGVGEQLDGFPGVMLGKIGQDDRGHGNGEDPQGKFHQAIGIVEPGDAACYQEGGDERVDE